MDERNQFRFFYPIEVRFGDLDALGHVNNAKFITYMEMARFKYCERVGLFLPGQPWEEVGIILAEVQCVYKAPLQYPAVARTYLRTAQIGNKSFSFHYRLEREDNGLLVALGRSVQVAYDYRAGQSRRVPDDWRAQIAQFEEWSEERVERSA